MTSTQFEGSIKDTNVLRLISDYVPAKVKELKLERASLIAKLQEINNDILLLETHELLIVIEPSQPLDNK